MQPNYCSGWTLSFDWPLFLYCPPIVMATIYIHIFYNNCLFFCKLIGLFLSSIRVQMDKILIYASFQHLYVHLSNCQLFNQWDFVDFLKYSS